VSGEAGGSAAAGAGDGGDGGGGQANDSICPPGPFGEPLPSGVTAQRVTGVPPADAFNQNNSVFGNIEGAVWSDGAIYVSEIGPGSNPPASRILKVTPAGVVSIARSDSGTNGLAVAEGGALYGASHKLGGLVEIQLGMPDRVLVDRYEGERLDSPNDLAIRRDGVVYFSDPSYQAPAPLPQTATRLYRWSAPAGIIALDTLPQPNGVTLSLDESKLYVSTASNVYVYPVNGDGSLGAAQLFNAGGSDGMVLDCAGNLYVTRKGSVVVLRPNGAQLGQIDVSGVQSVTNVAFGGDDRRWLFITALGTGSQKGLFKVRLQVPGLPY
jgi:gluconolactonase